MVPTVEQLKKLIVSDLSGIISRHKGREPKIEDIDLETKLIVKIPFDVSVLIGFEGENKYEKVVPGHPGKYPQGYVTSRSMQSGFLQEYVVGLQEDTISITTLLGFQVYNEDPSHVIPGKQSYETINSTKARMDNCSQKISDYISRFNVDINKSELDDRNYRFTSFISPEMYVKVMSDWQEKLKSIEDIEIRNREG